MLKKFKTYFKRVDTFKHQVVQDKCVKYLITKKEKSTKGNPTFSLDSYTKQNKAILVPERFLKRRSRAYSLNTKDYLFRSKYNLRCRFKAPFLNETVNKTGNLKENFLNFEEETPYSIVRMLSPYKGGFLIYMSSGCIAFLSSSNYIKVLEKEQIKNELSLSRKTTFLKYNPNWILIEKPEFYIQSFRLGRRLNRDDYTLLKDSDFVVKKKNRRRLRALSIVVTFSDIIEEEIDDFDNDDIVYTDTNEIINTESYE
jgi:hypothetical protein